VCVLFTFALESVLSSLDLGAHSKDDGDGDEKILEKQLLPSPHTSLSSTSAAAEPFIIKSL
jgi:hypothetical protein